MRPRRPQSTVKNRSREGSPPWAFRGGGEARTAGRGRPPTTATCAGAKSLRAPSPARPARTRRGKRPRSMPRAGLRHDPGRGRQTFGHYAGAAWLPNHRMKLSARADYTPAIYRHVVPRAHAREKAARDRPVSSPPVQRTDGRAAARLPWPRLIRAGTPAIRVRGRTIGALPSGHPYGAGRGGRPPVTGIAIWRSCGSAPGSWPGNARSA